MIAIRNSFLALLLLLTGCAAVGVPTPTTFNERLAVAYSTTTAVRQSALTLLTAKKITAADAENIQVQADTVRAGLDVARSLFAANPKAAEDKLVATQAVLTALRNYLIAKEGK